MDELTLPVGDTGLAVAGLEPCAKTTVVESNSKRNVDKVRDMEPSLCGLSHSLHERVKKNFVLPVLW